MNSNGNGGGGLEIHKETTLCEVPRGKERLRVMHTEATTSAGRPIAFHSIRVWYQNDAGEWCPGRAGVSIRDAELEPVTKALTAALASAGQKPTASPQPRPASVPLQGAPPHQQRSQPNSGGYRR